MPKQIQNYITVNRKRCNYRKRTTGKNAGSYELRFRRDGYNVTACGKTLALAKQRMLQKLKTATPEPKKSLYSIPTTFNEFALYYFKNRRARLVSEDTLKKDMLRYNKYLAPHFKETPLKRITLVMCQDLIDQITELGFGKTAAEVLSLMNVIFKFAQDNHLIQFRPSDAVLLIPHESESGKALTSEEEKLLLREVRGLKCEQFIALALFCGLRPNELKTAVIEGDFIKAVNSKRHGKYRKVEYKYIPIINRLRPYLPDDGVFTNSSLSWMSIRVHDILPNHKLYDLRTTFYTRCQIHGVAEPAMKEFMGHSFGELGNAYSDLAKFGDYLLNEGKKLNEWK